MGKKKNFLTIKVELSGVFAGKNLEQKAKLNFDPDKMKVKTLAKMRAVLQKASDLVDQQLEKILQEEMSEQVTPDEFIDEILDENGDFIPPERDEEI